MEKFLHLIPFTLLIVISSSGFAQGKWSSGYIISNEGEIIQGQIEIRDSRSNSDKCIFRKGEEGDIVEYLPGDIAAYRFTDGKYFVSKDLSDLGIEKIVFLEFLIKGRLNVYHFRDDLSHFCVEKEGAWFELTNTTRLIEENDKSYEIDKKEYLGLLNTLLEDADIQNDISHTILEGKSLIKLAKTYHEEVCPDEKCVIYEKKDEPIRIKKTLYIGATLSQVKISNALTSDYRLGSSAGIGFEFFGIFPFRENLSIKVDLAVQHFSTYTLVVDEGARGDFYYNNEYYTIWNENAYWALNSLDVNIKTSALLIPVSLNYSFSKSSFRPYIGAGITQMIFIAQRSDFRYISSYTIYEQAIPGYNLGYVARIGGEYSLNTGHALNFELRYENTMSLKSVSNLFFGSGIPTLSCGFTF